MSSVVALDKSGTYDCLLLSIGRIRPLMRGQYRRWVSAGAGRSQPLSPVPENCTGYYRQVSKYCHRYSEHCTFCVYVNPSAATRQKVIRNKAVRFPSLAGIMHTAPMGPTGHLRRKNLKAGSARSRAKEGNMSVKILWLTTQRLCVGASVSYCRRRPRSKLSLRLLILLKQSRW